MKIAFLLRLKKISKEIFETAGIEKLSNQFFDFYHFIKNQRTGLLDEIERLEDIIEAQTQVINQGIEQSELSEEGQRVTKKSFMKTKDAIIDLISHRMNMEKSYTDSPWKYEKGSQIK